MISTKAVMAFRIVSLFLVLFVHTAPQPMTSDTTLYSSHVPSSVMESSYVKKRCYHMNMSFTYNVSSGVSLSKNEAQTFMQSYVAPLLRRSLPLIDIGCSKSLTLTTGQTFTSPPGQVNMSVGASFTFAASRTIQDHRVDMFLQNCMALMRTKLAAWSIQQNLPVLNVSGVIYSANGVNFSRPRSCCGARPPPCNASTSQEVTATISGSVMSTKQALARSHLLTPALSSTAMLRSSTCVDMVSTVCIQSVPTLLVTSAVSLVPGTSTTWIGPPAKPPNNVRGHNTSSRSILVEWEDVPQEDQNGIIKGYRVKYKALPSGGDILKTMNSSDRQLTLDGLNEFTNYSICVLAFTVRGDGPESCILVVTDEDRPAKPPNNVRGHNTSSTSILLQWDDVPLEDQNGIIIGFRIIYAALLLRKAANREDTIRRHLTTLNGLNEFTNYGICVSAFTVKGRGPISCIMVVTDEDTPAKPPNNVTGHNTSSTSILVEWDDVPQADQNGIIIGYRVKYQALPSGGDILRTVNNSSDRELTLDGLNEFTNYNICVLAFTVKGDGPESCIFVVTAEDRPAKPPNNVRGHNTSSSNILVEWEDVPQEDKNGIINGYRVKYQALPSGGVILTETVPGSEVRELTLDGLNEFTNYSICVLAFTVKGDGPESCIFVVTAVDHFPEFTTHPENLTVTEGENVLTLSCSVRGQPIPDIVWRKDGSILDLRVLPRFNTSSVGGTSRLQVRTVSKFDRGEYSCWANNRAGNTTSYPGVLTVNYPPKILRSPVSQIKNGTQDMNISCTLEGKPRSDVKWRKNNKELVIDNRMTLTNTDTTWSLTIVNLRGEDSGLYACQATNEVGSATSNPGTLDVYYPPSINRQLQLHILLPLGAQLRLECAARGNPYPQITWTKDRSSKIPNARFSDRKRVLTVDSVRVDDIGEYQCAASNLLGHAAGNRTSVDVETLLTIINDGENFTVTEGDEVKLRCQASSLITPKLMWKRGDKRLESIQDEVSDDGKVVSGYLILEDVKPEAAGQYVCIARNGQKSVEAKMELTVNVKIVVEMELKLEGEEFSAGLKNSSSPEFRELASEFEKELSLLYQNMIGFKRVEVLEFRNGSVDVRFRVILVIKVKTPEEEPPPDVKVKVTRVVVVKVTESKGKIGKLRIKPESVRPKVEPPAPRNLTTVAIQKTEIRLIWSPPEFHEVYQVLKYIVEFKRFGKEWEERKTANNHIKTHRLLDLEADASYSVKVSATNEYGISIPSPILTTRTLSDREDMYWKIWLPVIIVVGVVLLLFVVYFCRRKRRSEIYYSNRLKEEERADIRLKYLNYAFEEHEISEDDDLAQRMLKGTWLEVSRDALVLGGELGSGMFGRVVKAWLQRESGETQVCAVKMLKANATELEYRDLANEVEIMSNVGEHPNLINLIGVCSIKGPLYVVVEFAEHGSLLEYLRQGRNDVNSNGLTNIEKFTIALGVAKGMNHLATMKCVHRDLSARNVLLAENMTPKVADFGLSRDVYERGFYEKTTEGKLPARWMAIEALERMMCTAEGDVWSFGVLLWEIETGGKMPYAGLEVKNLLKQLKSGYRLEKPIHCTDDIYDIMMRCWHGDPAKRPTFLGLCSELETFINGSPK